MNIYGLSVKFKEYGVWSKSYSYLSRVPYEINQAIIVPVGDWYAIGKVAKCVEDPILKDNIKYKYVITAFELNQNSVMDL